MDFKQFIKERDKWVKAGKPLRSQAEKRGIYDKCAACPNFTKGGGFMPGYDQCSLCGCNLHPTSDNLNKIAWGTTQCPDDPPRWFAN